MQKNRLSVKLYTREFGLNFADLKKSLIDGNNNSIYVIEGEDAYFRRESAKLLQASLISEPSLNLVKFEGEKLKDEGEFSALISSLTSFPFMSPRRMSVVTEFYPKAERVKSLSKLFTENDLSSSVLVIINEKAEEGLKKLPSVAVVDCKKQESSTLARWIKATCENDGVAIELETAKLLAEYCLCDMARISVETEKLICYALKKGVIDKQDLSDMVFKDSEYKIYEMTDFVAKKQAGKALMVVYEMIDKGETPQRLFVSVYNYFRRLLHVSISSQSDVELAKILGVKEFAVKKAKQQASRFKVVSLKRAVDMLSQADYRFKSGLSNIDDEFYNSLFKILLN